MNQHRLSSSNIYHRVFRDVPQFAGLDEADGKCIGDESWDKCLTDERRIVMLQRQGMDTRGKRSSPNLPEEYAFKHIRGLLQLDYEILQYVMG